uniref:Uncharacterized protein n=1 Tax=Globodera pallida TaxID=36090 RepID=A0A183CHI8_GLOPA
MEGRDAITTDNCAKGMLLIPALSSPSPPSAGGEIRRPCTLSLPPSFATSSVSSDGSSPAGTNGRKRRAATLSRIDLSAVASLTKELCSSSESLNGDKGIGGDARGGEGQQSPSLGAEESLATSETAKAHEGIGYGDNDSDPKPFPSANPSLNPPDGFSMLCSITIRQNVPLQKNCSEPTGDLTNGSKFSVRGKPKYDNEVPIVVGRLVPSVPGRISPPAAQVPSATTRVLFSPTGDSPPSLAELIELRRAQRHSPRWQRQQRASADQMELAWRHNERTRHLRALLADLPLFPRMAAGGTLAAATQQNEANRHGRAAEHFERHPRTVSESRRRSSERRRGQSPAFRSAQHSDQSERIAWAQPMHVLQRQQTHRSEDQAQIVPR